MKVELTKKGLPVRKKELTPANPAWKEEWRIKVNVSFEFDEVETLAKWLGVDEESTSVPANDELAIQIDDACDGDSLKDVATWLKDWYMLSSGKTIIDIDVEKVNE